MDSVKAKIIELVPEIASRGGMCIAKSPHPEKCEYETVYREITLADVLRAIGNSRERHGFTIDAQGDKLVMFWSTKDPENPDHSTLLRERWNLALSYDNQDQPTKDFIGKLIGITD